jgi:outer membrane protein insertion porin family
MMRRYLVLALLLTVVISASGQFRRRSNQPAPPAQDAPATESPISTSNPNEYFIAGIEITGLNVLDKNAMSSLTGLKVGDKVKIPGDNISSAIRKLWKHGLVGDVTISVDRIEGQNAYLIINLAERPRLTDFYFTGIPKGKQSSLREDLKLIKGKIVNDAVVRNTELSVKKYFAKKGFLNADVKVVQELDTLNRGGVRLRIDVAMNAKVKINEISFEGNEQISSSKLRGKMKSTHEHARITIHRAILGAILRTPPRKYKAALDSSHKITGRETKNFINKHLKLNIFNGSKFIKADYDDDKEKIIEFYNAEGYRDAEIVSDTVYRHGKDKIDVNIRVYEGRKYYFRNIIWTGNYLHSSATLDKILDVKKGDVYNKEEIDKKTSFNPKGADISGLYMDDGYLFFRVTPVEVAIVGDSIDLEMRIFEGDQATLDQVTFSGNERTSDHVIRRELSTVPGQKFRRSDIIRTQQMLSSMGYFNPQKIEPDVKPNPANSTVDIEWKLEEQSNDQIQLSGGWGGFYGFVGTVGLTFNNFSMRNVPHFDKWRPLPVGDGQRLSLQVQANGRAFQSYSISFTEPWLGGRKPNSFTVSMAHSLSSPTAATGGSEDVSLNTSSITLSLGRRLEWPDNYFTLTNSLTLQVYEYKNYLTGTNSLPPIGQTNSIIFNTTLARNSIDNPMFPTSGSSLSVGVSLTPPYSMFKDDAYYDDINTRYKWLEMVKWMIDTKFYLRLLGSNKPNGRSLVLEARAHLGFLGTYKKDLTPGPFERFYMGGAGLAGGFNSFVLGQEIVGLRGYIDNAVTPPLYYLRTTGNRTNEIEGGIVYDKFVMELRYPISLSQSATIYAFVFGEAGNNWNNFYDFNPFNSYRSAGFGARIFMPAFGLIGLNWAYGFDRLPGAPDISGSQFHFTIGQQIR